MLERAIARNANQPCWLTNLDGGGRQVGSFSAGLIAAADCP
jgi:hypothetical protein